jgi:hypothetical protein
MPPDVIQTRTAPAAKDSDTSTGTVWGRLALGLALLVGSSSTSEAQEGTRPEQSVNGINVDDLPRFLLPGCSEIPWNTARNLRFPLPADLVRDDYLYREVPGNSLHADHRNRVVIEARSADGVPSGCFVFDFAREQWRVMAEHSYDQDAFSTFKTHFGARASTDWKDSINRFESMPLYDRNYELFIAPIETNQSLHRSLKAASDLVLLDTILGPGNINELLPVESWRNPECIQRIIELARACSTDPERHHQLEALLIARGLSPEARNSYLPVLRNFSESLQVGLDKLREIFASEILVLSTRPGEGRFTLACALAGEADRRFELTFALDKGGAFQVAESTVQLGSDEPRVVSQLSISRRVTPPTFSHVIERCILAQASEIANLVWHVNQELLDTPDLSRFPDVARALAEPDIIAREIPEHLRHAKHRGPDIRVVEFAKLTDTSTPIACVVLDTGSIEPTIMEARYYHPHAIEQYQAAFPRMPLNVGDAAAVLKHISGQRRNYGLFFSSADSHAELRDDIASAAALLSLSARLEPIGGAESLATLPLSGEKLTADERQTLANFYGIELSDKESEVLPKLLEHCGMPREEREAFMKHAFLASLLPTLTSKIPAEAGLTADAKVILLPQPYGACILAAMSNPAPYTVLVALEISEHGKLVIGSIQREGQQVTDAPVLGEEVTTRSLARAVNSGLKETPEATTLLDHAERHFGMPRELLLPQLRDLSRNFVGGYDFYSGTPLAQFLIDAGDDWSKAEKIAKSLGVVVDHEGRNRWHSENLTLRDVDHMMSLLYLAREPLMPRIAECLPRLRVPMNFSFEPERRSTDLKRDLSTLLLVAELMHTAGFSAEPNLDGSVVADIRQFDRALRETIALVIARQELALQSSPELRSDGSRKPLRVVVVYDESLSAHAHRQAEELSTLLGADGKDTATNLVCINEHSKAELSSAMRDINARANELGEQIFLMPIVHGARTARGTALEFKDAQEDTTIAHFRTLLDPESEAFVITMSCNGGGICWDYESDPRALQNLSTTTSYTITPMLLEYTPAGAIKRALELEEKTILINGRYQTKLVPRCDLDGRGVTLREIQHYINSNTPLIHGRIFGPHGLRLSQDEPPLIKESSLALAGEYFPSRDISAEKEKRRS